MKKFQLLVLALVSTLFTLAQDAKPKDLFAFKITSYMLDLNDSTLTVQIQLPDGDFSIPKEQLGLLKRNFSNDPKDTAAIGYGRCHLIKSDYYYFAIHLYDKDRKPKENDLLYTYFDYPTKHKGQIFSLIKQAIYFNRVTEEPLFDFTTPGSLTAASEKALLDSMVADIKYTGSEMLKANDGQDQLIEGGIFNGQKLFAAMQTITVKNLTDFLDYVIARPQKYAGNSWKISETFATWMVGKTPMVIKN